MLPTCQSTIAITYHSEHLQPAAHALADELKLPVSPAESRQNEFSLVLTDHYLGLTGPAPTLSAPFVIDFLEKAWGYRISKASLKKEFIARAMGISPQHQPTIIDITAGLGRDSFILASLGYHVTMLERSPIIYALLRNALERAAASPACQPIVERLHLIHADASDYLPGKQADIIYLDPMFPARKKKSASVKKELVVLQTLLGQDPDANTLLDLSLSCAAKRVVVKRPRLAEPLGQHQPQFSYEGKSSRFDVYTPTPKGS